MCRLPRHWLELTGGHGNPSGRKKRAACKNGLTCCRLKCSSINLKPKEVKSHGECSLSGFANHPGHRFCFHRRGRSAACLQWQAACHALPSPPSRDGSLHLAALRDEGIGRISSHAQCIVLFCISRPGSQCGYREWAHCGPLHPGHNTLAVALHAGRSPTLSWLLNLGAIADSVGTGRRALFPATARDPRRTILEDNEGLSFCLARSRKIPILLDRIAFE